MFTLSRFLLQMWDILCIFFSLLSKIEQKKTWQKEINMHLVHNTSSREKKSTGRMHEAPSPFFPPQNKKKQRPFCVSLYFLFCFGFV